MNLEITRQAEAASEALEPASDSATVAIDLVPESSQSETIPKDRLGSAGRKALEGFPDASRTYILMSDPGRGLLDKWNEINESVTSVQEAFELGWRSNWPTQMSRATGNQNWAEIGLSWSRIKEAMMLFAHPIGSNVGPWRLTEGSPPIADQVAKLLMDSMQVLYDRLLSEVQRLSAIDIVPQEVLDAEHGPVVPLITNEDINGHGRQ
ncbi:hypothetical protein ABZT26_05505 [Streptomyces sp. NPDC005395]|uniref:hypothetical protein n=1 Tax=Streptomyces sp. NPDC005395 TaxID=3157042 RepID=UPI0033A0C641